MAEIKPGDLADKFLTGRRYHRPSLNQAELAKALGLSASMISRIETGERAPTMKTVESFARLLGVPVGWFFDGKPGPPPAPNTLTGFGSAFGAPPPAPSNLSHVTAEPGVGRRKFRLLGSVGAASAPLRSADPWPGDYVEFSDDLFREERYAIQVQGDSMHPLLKHGDYILVQPAVEVPRGLFTIARNDEHEYTVKVLKNVDGRHELHPVNPEYDPLIPGDDWQIVGYAVGLRRERGRGRYKEVGDNAGLRPDDLLD